MAAKYQILANLLREEITRSGRSGYRLPTEQALCQAYQMSRQTVRHALQILTEEGLIQRRQGSGSYVTLHTAAPAPMEIAVVVPYPEDYIYPNLLHEIQTAVSPQGYTLRVMATDNLVSRERACLAQLLQEPVRGVLIEAAKSALPTGNGDLYQQFARTRIPLLFFQAGHPELTGIPCISDDNYGGGYLLARHLLRQGHRRIGALLKSDDIQGPERYLGLISALRDEGVPLPETGICWYNTADRERILGQRDYALLHHHLNTGLSRATAILCYNDEVAYLLAGLLVQSGRRIPQDVAVVSFDNSYLSQMGPVPITSLWHQRQRMGQAAALQLMQMMDGLPSHSRSLSWTLNPRQSSQYTLPAEK